MKPRRRKVWVCSLNTIHKTKEHCLEPETCKRYYLVPVKPKKPYRRKKK